MERFVLSRHFDNCFGIALATVIFVAIFIVGTPAWTFVPLAAAGLSLSVRLHHWAWRRVNDE